MEEIPTNPTCRDTEQVCGKHMDLDPPPSRYHPLQRKGEREGKKRGKGERGTKNKQH